MKLKAMTIHSMSTSVVKGKAQPIGWMYTFLLLACTSIIPMEVQAQVTITYIHTDALGSVVATTDTEGNLIDSEFYDAYGARTSDTERDQPGFAGHVEDEATKLTYMQQRYYDPQIGQFLSLDPVAPYSEIGEHFNRYSYAYNNPFTFSDPDGRAPDKQKEPPPPPPPTPLPTVTAIAPPIVQTLPTVTSIAPRPIPLQGIPWPAVGEFVLPRLALPLLLVWPNEIGVSPCEEPGGPPCGATEMYSKGKENVRDSGLRDVSDEEIRRRARQPGLSGKEKRRYQTEEKARGLRNKSKREENG